MTMLPTFLAGTNFVMHSAGWLEGGLVSCYEKFIIDIELLRMLRVEFTPLEIDEAALAFDAHLEVGHGGHFLGAEHTMTRFRDCFYRPILSSSMNFERWSRQGALDAAAGVRDLSEMGAPKRTGTTLEGLAMKAVRDRPDRATAPAPPGRSAGRRQDERGQAAEAVEDEALGEAVWGEDPQEKAVFDRLVTDPEFWRDFEAGPG